MSSQLTNRRPRTSGRPELSSQLTNADAWTGGIPAPVVEGWWSVGDLGGLEPGHLELLALVDDLAQPDVELTHR